MGLSVLLLLAWALPAYFLLEQAGWFLAWVGAGCFYLPFVALLVRRAALRTRYSFVKSEGHLLLDGEPLELARVELRAIEIPVIKRAAGYELSLWLMTLGGPKDVPVGQYASLLKASAASGTLESFVKTASRKPRVSLS
jgi:uncharacterized membrane protein YhdT